jgi:type II secretory pathway pseudopilin PulG
VRWDPRAGGAEGETLVELLVTVSIMGIAIITLVLAIGTAVRSSDVHRKQATTESLLRNYAEGLQASSYVNCASTYATPSSFTASANYSIQVTRVQYWNGQNPAGFTASCGTDTGIQLITIKASSSDGRSTRTLDVVKRKP